MFTLEDLPKIVLQRKQRVGRGNGSQRGKNSGKGNKGQTKRGGKRPVYFIGDNSDSGHSPLARNPKRKGFKARVNKQETTVHLKAILDKFESGSVNLETLLEHKLINAKITKVKIIKTNGIEKVESTIKFDESKNLVLSKGVKELFSI